IEQDRPIRKRPDRSRDVGEALGAVLRVARKQCHLGTLLVGEDAKPVVLLLVDPTGRVEGRIHQTRQHGSHAKGNAVFQAWTSSGFRVGAFIKMQFTAVLRTALPIAGGLPLVACSHFSTPSPSWNATHASCPSSAARSVSDSRVSPSEALADRRSRLSAR